MSVILSAKKFRKNMKRDRMNCARDSCSMLKKILSSSFPSVDDVHREEPLHLERSTIALHSVSSSQNRNSGPDVIMPYLEDHFRYW